MGPLAPLFPFLHIFFLKGPVGLVTKPEPLSVSTSVQYFPIVNLFTVAVGRSFFNSLKPNGAVLKFNVFIFEIE